MIWLAGSGLAVSLLLIFGLLALVAVRGPRLLLAARRSS